jgi:hypothetical protein
MSNEITPEEAARVWEEMLAAEDDVDSAAELLATDARLREAIERFHEGDREAFLRFYRASQGRPGEWRD